MARGRGRRIGIALGRRSAVAVILGRRGAPTAHCAGVFEDDSPRLEAELLRAFGELKASLEAKGVGPTEGSRVDVALLPPLADARVIAFPPMRQAEAEAVLKRDVARYFLGNDRLREVGVRLPRGGGRSPSGSGNESVPIFAAAAATPLLETVRRALGAVGWRCGSTAPAHGGWVAAATAGGAGFQRVVAVADDTVHVLRLRGDHPEGVRQIPLDDLGGVTEAMGTASGRALVLTSPREFEALQLVLTREGWSVSRDPEGWGSAEEGAAARADSGGPELVPPSLREERRRQRRKRAAYMLAGVAVLLLASAGAHLWGAYRELDALQERRAAIRGEVGPLLMARDSLDALSSRVRALEELSQTAPVWTRCLVELTALLPRDTYLTAFYASGDTVELEAAGTRAGEAIQILRESGIFEELRLQGIVERELAEGETVEERFTVRGRLPKGSDGGGP